MGIVFTVFIIISLVYIYKKREEEEAYLAIKVVGYYLLGSFRFNFNSLIIPLGFALYLIFFRPSINKKVKRLAATFGFIIFCFGVISPIINDDIFSREIKVTMASSNINSIDFTFDLNVIRDRFKLKNKLDINNFEVRYNKDGEIENIMYELIDYNNPKRVHYTVSYYKDASGVKNKYSISRYNVNSTFQLDEVLDADYFFANIDKIKNEKIDYDFDVYTISLMGVGDTSRQGYNIKDKKTVYIDKSGNARQLTNDELPVKGAWVYHYGSVIDSINSYNTSSHGSDIGAVNYILEN